MAFAKLFMLYFPEPSNLILRDTGATLDERYRQFIMDVAGHFNGAVGREFQSLTEGHGSPLRGINVFWIPHPVIPFIVLFAVVVVLRVTPRRRRRRWTRARRWHW